jgi:hypothetical protein
MQPLPAGRALEQFFLDARCKLLDLAATLDRIGRGEGSASAATDPRIERIQKALAVLMSDAPNKAEAIQQVFSQEYDAAWKRPQPRF